MSSTLWEVKWWDLAKLADCGQPDSSGSAGSDFLVGIRNAVAESWNNGDNHDQEEAFVHETADSAVPVYTHDRWKTYVDLCAYQEDISDLAGASGSVDMTELAGLALYQIAERLVRALAEKLAEDQTD